jgi:hypothetical protein
MDDPKEPPEETPESTNESTTESTSNEDAPSENDVELGEFIKSLPTEPLDL